MKIEYLKEFVVLSNELSFSNAAELLYISQPALSKHIKSLEKELGSNLFIRSAKKISLTNFGKEYLTYAKRIMEEYEKSENARVAYLEAAENTIVLGATLNFQEFDLDKYMIEFSKIYPEYKFELIEASDRELLAMFNEGRINMFSAGIRDNDNQNYEFSVVKKGKMYAYVNKENRLSKKESLTIAELCNERLFLPYRGTDLLTWIEDAAADHNVSLSSRFYGSLETAKAFARANMGIAIIHIEGDEIEEEPGIQNIIINPSIGYSIGVGYRSKNLSKAEKVFLKYAKSLNR